MEWKSSLKRIVPEALWRPGSNLYWWWINRGRHKIAWDFSIRRRRSVSALREYRDRHLGERCFILGNGPSLKSADLGLLKNEITFGLNRVYLLFPDLGFTTTYYVGINTLVIEQCAHEIKQLMMPRFITWRGRKWVKDDPNIIFLDTDYTPPATFSADAIHRIFEGSTVTYVALQLAYYFGFSEVILIGVDHYFKTKGPPNKTVVSQGGDEDHFAADYFGKGFRWQLPDLEASEQAYRMAQSAFEAAGRRVLDATIGGKLTVFPKVDYIEILKEPVESR
jgi:hypothetical protein